VAEDKSTKKGVIPSKLTKVPFHTMIDISATLKNAKWSKEEPLDLKLAQELITYFPLPRGKGLATKAE
jgi:hypothetical protein